MVRVSDPVSSSGLSEQKAEGLQQPPVTQDTFPETLSDAEVRRLEALHRLQLLDTSPEPSFDRLVRLAARLLDTPIALITLVDRDRQWFKAKVGLDIDQTGREIAFCSHAIESHQVGPFVIEDATVDRRFADNPLVTGAPFIRFYAGAPLHTSAGERIGTLCVIGRQPRQISEADQQVLGDLAVLVEDLVVRHELQTTLETLRAAKARDVVLRETIRDGIVIHDAYGEIVDWNSAAEALLDLTADELAHRTARRPSWNALRADGSPWPSEDHPALEAIRTAAAVRGVTMGIRCDQVGTRWLRIDSTPIIETDGTVTGAVTTLADITGPRRREQATGDAISPIDARREETGPADDVAALTAALERYGRSLDDTAGTLASDRRAVEALLVEIAVPGALRTFLTTADLNGGRPTLTQSIAQLEESRRTARYHLFSALLAEGASIGEIGRIWNISRQLASRILREGKAADPA